MTANELQRRLEMARAGIALKEDGCYESARQVLLDILHDSWKPEHIDGMLYGLRIYGKVRVLQAAEAAMEN